MIYKKSRISIIYVLTFIIFFLMQSCGGSSEKERQAISIKTTTNLLISIRKRGKNIFEMLKPGFCPMGGKIKGDITIWKNSNTYKIKYKCTVDGKEKDIEVRLSYSDDESQFNVKSSPFDDLDVEKRYLIGDINLRAGEHIWGFGENFDSVENTGFQRPMQLEIAPWSKSGLNEVHLPIPFYISSRGYGFFIDSYSEGEWDVGYSDPSTIKFQFYTNELKGYIFLEEDPYEIIKKYIEITGKPALPPEWGFGILWWRDEYDNEDEIMDDINKLRELDIPLSVVWIDAPWETGHNTYDYNPVQFPDPWGMITRMRNKGVLTFNWITEHINNPSKDPATKPYFDYGVKHNFFVKNSAGGPLILPWGRGNGAILDFTNPEASKWWRSLVEKPLMAGGYGFKLDYGEDVIPYLSLSRGSIAHMFIYDFYNGENETQMHAYYKYLYHKNAMDACQAIHGLDCFLIARTGTIGDQQNVTAIWPGDLDNDFSWSTANWGHSAPDGTPPGNVGGLKAAVLASINLNIVGFPYFGSDIGGYRGGTPEADVMARWIEFGAFSPIFQYGGAGDRRPWVVYDTKLIDIFRKYTQLYVKMFPYIYSAALKAHEGYPMVKSISMEYKNNEETWKYPFEYLFGDTILVAPVVDDTDRVSIYLPKGTWYDFYTEEIIKGPHLLGGYLAPLDVIPHFARAGSILYLHTIPQTFIDVTGMITLKDVEKELDAEAFLFGSFSSSYYNGVTIAFQGDRGKGILTIDIPKGFVIKKFDLILPYYSGDAKVTDLTEGSPLNGLFEGNKVEITNLTGYHKIQIIHGVLK